MSRQTIFNLFASIAGIGPKSTILLSMPIPLCPEEDNPVLCVFLDK